jgi:serine phosphatase RsbU (regulator of sigma subunit)
LRTDRDISRRKLRIGIRRPICRRRTVFYTDGVTEAQNDLGEEFGTERLSALLERGSSLSAESLMSAIFRSVADFCNRVGFADDVTILVVKCNFDGSM